MDLTKFLGQDSQEQSAQRLSKEEYAAQKKQEREEIWGMIGWERHRRSSRMGTP